ncbi:hypothetical protein GW17_00048868, partial [Ensete ventricosum]
DGNGKSITLDQLFKCTDDAHNGDIAKSDGYAAWSTMFSSLMTSSGHYGRHKAKYVRDA